MDLESIPLMAAFKSRMKYLNQNQSVLAENIANVNTPGYKPQTLAPQDFSALVEQAPSGQAGAPSGGPAGGAPSVEPVALAATQPGHQGGARGDQAVPVEEAEFASAAPNGNAVDLENQLTKVAQNQMDYGLMVDLYRKHASLVSTALRGPGGSGR